MKSFKIIGVYLKQLTHYFSASLIPLLLNLLINPLVALSMDPSDFAILGYFTSFSSLISPIIVFYMLHYYNKRYFELDDCGREMLRALLYKALIFFSFSIALVCLIVLYIYIEVIANTNFTAFPYLFMSVLTIPFTGIYSLELADYKMKRMSRSYFNLSLLKGVGSVLAVLIFVVLLHWGATGRLFATLFVDVSVFLYLLFKHKDVWKIKTNLKELKTVLMFCWPLALGAALGYFSNGYDKSVLEPIGNIDEYGYYCVGLSIAGYLGIFTSTISATFQPDTYEAIISGNISRIFKIASLRLGLTLLVVVIFLLFCPLVVRILTAGKYLAAVPYARIMSISALTSSAYYIINDYSIAKGKPYMYLITTILGSIVIIFLMPVFVFNFSYIGGALMNVLSFVIFLVINLMLLVLLSAKSINKV